MSSFKEKARARVDRIRERRPLFDHLVRTVQHYGNVKGTLQAGAVTYFGFLSFFPILALAFAVVGIVARVYPVEDALVKAIGEVLPGIVGDDPGEIGIEVFQQQAPSILSIGLVAVLYSGLGWLSAMRQALLVVFEMPKDEAPNFVLGKLRDLLSLALIGLTLVVSVALAGFISGFSSDILTWLGLGSELEPLLRAITIAVGLAANMLLFFALFRLLAKPPIPARALWAGALLGAIGFELLKLLSAYLIQSTKSQPAFQAFGIALILVVWINYFSRVVMLSASWAHTSPAGREIREAEERERARLHELARVDLHEAPAPEPVGAGPRLGAFAAGGASTLAAVALWQHRRSS